MKVLFFVKNLFVIDNFRLLMNRNEIEILICNEQNFCIESAQKNNVNLLVVEEGVLDNEQDFLQEMRANKSLLDLPILFLCKSANYYQKVISYEDFGVHDYLQAPYDSQEFLFKMRNLFRLAETIRPKSIASFPASQEVSHLTQEQIHFLQVLEMMPLGFLVYNEKNKLVFMNHAAELLTGYSLDNFLNNSMDELSAKLDLKGKFDDLSQQKNALLFRDTLCNKHKRIVNIERKCVVVDVQNKVQTFKLDIWRDITTSLELELLLEARIEERSQGIIATQNITMMALASLADSRDNETGLHLERMRTYSQIIAQDLLDHQTFSEINRQFVLDIFSSSPLHDIGKVGTPDYVLLKPGKLTAEEWEVMKQHPIIGAKTLQDAINQGAVASFLVMAHDICLGHHEHYDGSGYPYNKIGHEIPLSARIVALADCYDALRSERVYKRAYTHNESKQIIIGKSGIYYDPKIVESFLRTENKFIEISEKFKDKIDKPYIDRL